MIEKFSIAGHIKKGSSGIVIIKTSIIDAIHLTVSFKIMSKAAIRKGEQEEIACIQ
jgi:hypothetical protein